MWDFGLMLTFIGVVANVHFLTMGDLPKVSGIQITQEEQVRLGRAKAWGTTGCSYAYEHGTRPSTIALVLQSNPIAMLAWYVFITPF